MSAATPPSPARTPTPAPTAGRRSRLGTLGVLGPLMAYGAVALGLSGCLGFPPRPMSQKLPERVEAFPTQGLPLHAPASIRWNDHQIPWIEAQDDRDLPFLVGMVQAHQRLAQMEILRRVSQARLAEMAGPIAGFLDATLRAVDFGRASQATWETMRPDTKAWLERFCAGVNEYRRRVRQRPAEFRSLAISEEDWTPIDVLTLGRLAGTDINWSLWYSTLRHRAEPKWPEVYERLKRYGLGAAPSFGPSDPLELAGGLSKSGSNTFAVAGSRTATGAALIANDPHVGLTLPNLWMVMGLRSPSFHAVGMMLPGIPVVLLGRNDRIAWGGTNMRSLSTGVYDASKFPPSAITTREVTIEQRWWVSRRETIRETPVGPIITDTPLFSEARRNGPPVAFAWRGHEPSDELTAFLDMNRARDFESFRKAFEPYAVSGQNFLYADPQGNIGQVLALEFDLAAGRTALVGVGDPTDPAMAWGRQRVRSTDLPHAFNPPAGYLVSSNNTPVRTDPPVTIVANGDSRFFRIGELIETAPSPITVEKAASIQMDVYSKASAAAARSIADRARGLADLSSGARRALGLIEAWDGRYAVDSAGAPVFQAAAFRLAQAYYTQRYGPRLAQYLLNSEAIFALLAEDLASTDPAVDAAIPAALDGADGDIRPGVTWGDRHKLRVSHVLGNIPVFGSAWRFGEFGVQGSLQTVFKTANNVTNRVHNATYGANSRHISDLSDPDENYFVLLGGQDGWVGSANFLDQVELWRTGGRIKVPMRPESVRAWATSTTTLTPGPAPTAAGEQWDKAWAERRRQGPTP